MKKFLVNLSSVLWTQLVWAGLAFADGIAVPAGGAPAPVAGAQQPPGLASMLVPVVPVILVFYFIMVRPQQKKIKEQQTMLGALQHGDDVLTSSGMLGKVTGITDKVVTLEIADNVRVKMLKSTVSQIVKGPIKELAQ